jgi:DNA replication protein DnaC
MKTTWLRTWPPELAIHQLNPKAIPLDSGQDIDVCQNCGGHQIMMVFIIESGPYKQPLGKVKWLDLESGSGWYLGKLEIAPCPVCKKGQLDHYLSQNCGLRGQDLGISISDFKTTGIYAGKLKARKTVENLLAMNHVPFGFVSFTGEYGVGKSHLLKSIVNGFRTIHVMAHYTTLADLLANIREQFGNNTIGSAETVIENFRRARVLAIDEVDDDRVNLTGWAKETIFRLLNSRYEDQDSLLTVLASNKKPAEFPNEMQYLASRFTGGITVHVPGPDVRPAMGVKAEKSLFNTETVSTTSSLLEKSEVPF